MYTQCSSCATLFRVSARHLREAQGQVRCCLCHETFSALLTLTETLPPGLSVEALRARSGRPVEAAWSDLEPSDPASAAGPSEEALAPDEETVDPVAETPVLDEITAEPIVEALPLDEIAADAAAEASALDEAPPDLETADDDRDLFAQLELPEPAPARFEPPPPPRTGTGGTVLWTLASLALIALIVIQYGNYLVSRSVSSPPAPGEIDFVRDPRYRPWFEMLCLVARCELPLLRDLDSVHILQRRVSAPPGEPRALLVRATLVNDANFPQPYPELRLSFLDGNGREQASRWFEPREYLEDPATTAALAAGMPPKQPVAVRLELVDPGEETAENFEFDFR